MQTGTVLAKSPAEANSDKSAKEAHLIQAASKAQPLPEAPVESMFFSRPGPSEMQIDLTQRYSEPQKTQLLERIEPVRTASGKMLGSGTKSQSTIPRSSSASQGLKITIDMQGRPGEQKPFSAQKQLSPGRSGNLQPNSSSKMADTDPLLAPEQFSELDIHDADLSSALAETVVTEINSAQLSALSDKLVQLQAAAMFEGVSSPVYSAHSEPSDAENLNQTRSSSTQRDS
jgi:hypothetical protein